MSILMKGKRKSQSNNGSRSRAKHSSLPLPSHSFFKFTLNKSKGAQRVLVLLGDRHKSRRPSNSLDFLLRFGQAKCQFLRTVKNLHVPQKRSRPAGDRGEQINQCPASPLILSQPCPSRRGCQSKALSRIAGVSTSCSPTRGLGAFTLSTIIPSARRTGILIATGTDLS